MGNNVNDYLMISGIQHFDFCKRQWALIHIEQQWEENVRTIEGKHLHEKADEPFVQEKRGKKLMVRGLPIKSHELQVTGVCDVVEFVEDDNGIEIFGYEGKYLHYPVEYIRDKPKTTDADHHLLKDQVIFIDVLMICY